LNVKKREAPGYTSSTWFDCVKGRGDDDEYLKYAPLSLHARDTCRECYHNNVREQARLQIVFFTDELLTPQSDARQSFPTQLLFAFSSLSKTEL
jgi:hypothetical protein